MVDYAYFSDGLLVGVFSLRGHLTIQKTGTYTDGSHLHRPAARVIGFNDEVPPAFNYLALTYGGSIKSTRYGKSVLEFLGKNKVEVICSALADSPVDIPAYLSVQLNVMLEFLSMELPKGGYLTRFEYETIKAIKNKREELYQKLTALHKETSAQSKKKKV